MAVLHIPSRLRYPMFRWLAKDSPRPRAILIVAVVLLLAAVAALVASRHPRSQPAQFDPAAQSPKRADAAAPDRPPEFASNRRADDAPSTADPITSRDNTPGTEVERATGKVETDSANDSSEPKPAFQTIVVTISGQVEDVTGAGVGDVEVFVHRPWGKDWGLSIDQSSTAARTCTDGSFQFDIEFRHVMQGQAVGLDLWPIKSGLASESPVELRGLVGGGRSYNVRIVLVGAGSVRGRIEDSAGQPLSGANVTATSVVSGRRPHLGTRVPVATDAGGNYQIDALAPGAWEINAKLDGYDPSEGIILRIEAGKWSDVRPIRLTKNTWITMRLLHDNGTEIEATASTEATVRIEFRTATGRESWTEVPAKLLPRGELKIQVHLYTPTSLTVRLAGFHESERTSLRFKEGEVNDVGEIKLSREE